MTLTRDDLLRAAEIVSWRGNAEADALASSLRAAAEGCVVVPREPTEGGIMADAPLFSLDDIRALVILPQDSATHIANLETAYADALRRLSALQADARWISVSDRLPDVKAAPYLVYIGADHDYGWAMTAIYEPKTKRKPSWCWYEEPAGINPIVAGVTHWMQLPAAPK